jgi:hypothetical protein
MEIVDTKDRKKPGKKKILPLLIIGFLLVLAILGAAWFQYINKPVAEATLPPAPTVSPSLSPTPTCPNNIQLSTPIGVNQTTKLIVIVYDPIAKAIPGLDLVSGERVSDVTQFVSKIIPDMVKPGYQISVFQIGTDSYTSARVTRQYSYLTIYPQLYVPPSYSTLTPLPPTSIPTPGFGEVATKNASRVVATERAATETAISANYNCEVTYYNDNVQSTATAWKQMVESDKAAISTAEAADLATVTPGKGRSEELLYGGWYYGLYFASVDFQADCKKYDQCILILVGDLHTWRVNNPDTLPIALDGIDVYAIMPGCRDINQPDCGTAQSYWTSELNGFGVNKLLFWNGVRAEYNLLGEIGR